MSEPIKWCDTHDQPGEICYHEGYAVEECERGEDRVAVPESRVSVEAVAQMFKDSGFVDQRWIAATLVVAFINGVG